jgi:hypothetical protein
MNLDWVYWVFNWLVGVPTMIAILGLAGATAQKTFAVIKSSRDYNLGSG